MIDICRGLWDINRINDDHRGSNSNCLKIEKANCFYLECVSILETLHPFTA